MNSQTLLTYLYLAVAIVAEVIGTTALKLSDSFTRPLPTLVTAVGYGIAFYMLTLVLRSLPTGVVYAIWSGVGIVLISVVGWLWQGQSLNAATMVGMGLIVVGVAVVNVFSPVAH